METPFGTLIIMKPECFKDECPMLSYAYALAEANDTIRELCEVAEGLAEERLRYQKLLDKSLDKEEMWLDKCWKLLNDKEELLRKLYG
jgi:hypothetical protein